MDWTDDDSSDWSFEEERPMPTHRSHHKKPAPTKVPELHDEPPPPAKEPDPPMTPAEYQEAVIERLDGIIAMLTDILTHMRGQ